jgi:hypothetical protein
MERVCLRLERGMMGRTGAVGRTMRLSGRAERSGPAPCVQGRHAEEANDDHKRWGWILQTFELCPVNTNAESSSALFSGRFASGFACKLVWALVT